MAERIRYLMISSVLGFALAASPVSACDSVNAEPIFAPAPIIFVGKLTEYEVVRKASGEPVTAVLTYEVAERMKGMVGERVRLNWDGAQWGERIPEAIQAPLSEIVGAAPITKADRELSELRLFTDGCGERFSVPATQENIAALNTWITSGEAEPLKGVYQPGEGSIHIAAQETERTGSQMWPTIASGLLAVIGLAGLTAWLRRRKRAQPYKQASR